MVSVIDGHEVSKDCFELMERLGAVNTNNEFKRWLHVWVVGTERSNDQGHVMWNASYPWVPLWEKPDLSAMMATYYVTDFVNFPTSWEDIWYDLNEAIEARRAKRLAAHGPYWMLLSRPSSHAIAGEMASMKRRLANELQRSPEPLRHRPLGEVMSLAREQFVAALQPFRVMSIQQESEDEAVRTTEERRNAVRGWDRPTSRRPPRCR